ncbi:uncharacterized protein LOC144874385 [Branchiostoma floridae x Branchiostoma japonicum]
MKVALLIAVMLASVIMVDSLMGKNGFLRRKVRFRRREPLYKQPVYKKAQSLQEVKEAIRDAAGKLQEAVDEAESHVALDLMEEVQDLDGSNGDLNGVTFEKKVAALEEADANLEEAVKEAEEDAALGLVEEELEKLEEELEEVNNGLKE